MSKVSKILATTYSTALCYSTYIRRREYNDNEAVCARVGLIRFFPPRFARNYLKYNLLTRDVSKLIPDSLAAGASKA